MEDDIIIRTDQLMTNWRLNMRHRVMSLAEAEERFLIGGRKPKWRRILHALWRVKDA